MASQKAKSTVLLASILLAPLGGWWIWQRESAAHAQVQMIDNVEQLGKLLMRTQRPPEEIPLLEFDTLVEREPWSESLALTFFPMIKDLKRFRYDPTLGWRRTGGKVLMKKIAAHPKGGFEVRLNELGLRDRELTDRGDLRIVFAGDSQTEGVCNIDESFVNLLEDSLSEHYTGQEIDAINAGLGGSNPWRYLETLEERPGFDPHIFVAVFYGGNDFQGVVALERYYRGRGPWRRQNPRAFVQGAKQLPKGLSPVELRQVQYFLDMPEDREIMVRVWGSLAMEMSRQCEAAGIEFLPVYLPPPLAGQPEAYAEERAATAAVMPEVAEAIDMTQVMADHWIRDLNEQGVEVFDLRPALRSSAERLFWDDGYHLNLEGQAVLAKAFEERLAGLISKQLDG